MLIAIIGVMVGMVVPMLGQNDAAYGARDRRNAQELCSTCMMAQAADLNFVQDESVIESFSNFKSDYEQDMQISISEDFPINNQAVKKQQRHFKSIIKLDKNFHIYVHGDHTKIRKGIDGDGNKYYQIFYDEET